MVDPLWEDWGRDGQIKTVCDMCRVCPTGKKCYRSCQHFDHRENMAFVRQTALYRFSTCCFGSQLHIRVLSFCGQVLLHSVQLQAALQISTKEPVYFLCGTLNFSVAFVWHWGGDINSKPSIQLINKISTVLKLCRIDWFFGFIMCQDVAAVM